MTTPSDIIGYPPQLQPTENVLTIIGGAPAGATLTAASTTTVTVSQTGTGAIHVTPNATGGLLIAGATTTPIVVGASTNHLGFFGADPVVQQDASGVTTVAELLVLLENLGLVHS